jgi:hypothetical protein
MIKGALHQRFVADTVYKGSLVEQALNFKKRFKNLPINVFGVKLHYVY